MWYRILEHIGTLFYYKQDSSMHMTEIIFYDLFIFNIPLAIIPVINNSASSANSLSMYIFGAINFHLRRIWYENLAPKPILSHFMELVSAACVMGISVS